MLAVCPARPVNRFKGPAVAFILVKLVSRLKEPWFNSDDQPGAQPESAACTTIIGNVWLAMHNMADAMPAELKVYRVAVACSDLTDSRRDISQTVARDGFAYSCVQRFFRALDKAEVFRPLA